MVKRILAIISAIAMLMAFMPCAFAEGETAIKIFAQEDFEGTAPYFEGATNSLSESNVTTDTENTSNYYNKASGLVTLPEEANGTVVIDFRAKVIGTGGYFSFDTRQNKNYLKASSMEIVGQGEEWRYYRIVMNYDAEEQNLEVYRSKNGFDSLSRITSAGPKADKKTVRWNFTDVSGFNQFQFSGCMFDDVTIYKNAQAPIASNVTVTNEGRVYTANYNYSDAENDAEGTTAYQWESSADGVEFTAIEGATEKTYTADIDFDKYLRVNVTPKSKTTHYPTTGASVASDAVKCEKGYRVLVDEDFENVTEGDKINGVGDTIKIDGIKDAGDGTKYYEQSSIGYTAFSDGKIVYGKVAIDLYAAVISGTTLAFKTRLTDYTKQFDINVSKDTSWNYYRILIDYDAKAVSLYKSATGYDSLKEEEISWSSFTDAAIGFDRFQISNVKLGEIKIYQYGTAPVATNAGVTEENRVYTASYTYSDAEGDAEGNTTLVWETSTDGIAYTAVSGETGKTYSPNVDFEGYVRARITPASTRYPDKGEEIVTEALFCKKGYKVIVQEDFEGEAPYLAGTNAGNVSATNVANGDGINTSKFYSTGTSWIKFNSIVTDSFTYDFRAKPLSNGYFSINFIENDSNTENLGIVILGQTDGVWKDYRIVVEKSESGNNVSVYSSNDGFKSLTKLPVGDNSTARVTDNDFTSVKYMQISNCAFDDIVMYRNGDAPVIESTSITEENGVYTANYVYNDAQNDAEGNTEVVWEMSTDNESFIAIDGATGKTYTPESDVTGYIRAVVTPVSTRYPEKGEAVVTDAVCFAGSYTEYINEDFEGEDISIWKGYPITEGDGVNNTKFHNADGEVGFSTLPKMISGKVTIDFYAKSSKAGIEGQEWFLLVFRQTDWNRTISISVDGETPKKWGYYRVELDTIAKTGEIYYSDDNYKTLKSLGVNGKVQYSSNEGYELPDGVDRCRAYQAHIDDLVIYKNGAAPTATGASITSTKDGFTTALIGYADKDGDAAAAPLYQWQVSDDGVTFTDAEGETGELFLPEKACYVRAKLTPASVKSPAYGEAVYSEAVYSDSFINISKESGKYSVNAKLSGISEAGTMWAVLAVYSGNSLVEAVKSDVTAENGVVEIAINGTVDVSESATSAKLLLWKAGTMVPVVEAK